MNQVNPLSDRFDLEGDVTPDVRTAVEQFLGARADASAHVELAKEASVKAQRWEREGIPIAMDMAGLAKTELVDGTKVAIVPVVDGSLPSLTAIDEAGSNERPVLIARRERGLAWLRANGQGSVIKTQIIIDIGKDEALARVIASFLVDLQTNFITGDNVHPMTLKKVLGELHESGVEIDEAFAPFIGRRAKVTPPKAR